jgi:transcriptional regulator with XRE-family HTH domain
MNKKPSHTALQQSNPLLLEILIEAQKHGLTQKQLATNADMAPESLSRIVKTGRMEYVTLAKLANAVGLSLFIGKDTQTA